MRVSADQARFYKGKMVKLSPLKVEIEYKDVQLTCPYCLYTAYITKFYIRLKSGRVSERRFQCPDCEQIMLKRTLIKEMSIEEFAEWMLATEAWSRVSFDKFRKRLIEMGISFQFWDAYKKVKAKMTGETYEEHMEQSQEEWAKEEGLK